VGRKVRYKAKLDWRQATWYVYGKNGTLRALDANWGKLTLKTRKFHPEFRLQEEFKAPGKRTSVNLLPAQKRFSGKSKKVLYNDEAGRENCLIKIHAGA